MTVSPRKRVDVVRPPGDSPEAWLSGANFKFAESPALSRRSAARRSVKKSPVALKNRRQSMILKRLNLPLDSISTSPNVRRTRRQSMGPQPRRTQPDKSSRLPRAVSDNAVQAKKTKTTSAPRLPPAPKMVVVEEEKVADVSISPVKFYSSRKSQAGKSLPQLQTGAMRAKRKSIAPVTKVETSRAQRKASSMSCLDDAPIVSPLRLRSTRTVNHEANVELVKSAKKRRDDPEVVASEQQKETKTPRKTKKVEENKENVKASPQQKETKTPRKTKKVQENKENAKASPQLKETKTPRKTKKVEENKEIAKTSPQTKVSVENKEKKTLKAKSIASSSLRKNLEDEVDASHTPAKRVTINSPMRATRSVTRSSQRFRLVEGRSSFRKTPSRRKSKTPGKAKDESDNEDNSASPALSSTRAQLQVIRCNSPLAAKPRTPTTKAFTPKPDRAPRSVLRQNMKRKVAEEVVANIDMEVERLMDPEISTPVKGEDVAPVLPSTPASCSNLPPTPTSSRTYSVTRRAALRTGTPLLARPRTLGPTTPRSSTPIHDNTIATLEASLASQDKDIMDDDEEEHNEEQEEEQEEKTENKRSYCSIM